MTFINIRTLSIILLSSLSTLKTEIIDRRPLKYGYIHHVPDTSVHKVTLTQKGYIQFLQYIAKVPTITDFTFCIWLKSFNLTHPHPLLSYSRHDTERWIRGWITSGGKNLNLEILEREIFSVPVNLLENQWYHICQSWASSTGVWMAFVNGETKSYGIKHEMRSIKIPQGGEIVVGQEYTDFDKGLDDGIEGDIYGFNFVLAGASGTSAASDKQTPLHILPNEFQLAQRRQQLLTPTSTYTKPMNIHGRTPQFDKQNYDSNYQLTPAPGAENLEIQTESDVPQVLSYFSRDTNRYPRGIMDFGKNIFSMFDIFGQEKTVYKKVVKVVDSKPRETINYAPNYQGTYNKQPYVNKRIFNTNTKTLNGIDSHTKSLGLALVELSYSNCALGKGSPIRDKRLLISWTKTPVRVFGGATLKSISPFCKKHALIAR